MYVPALSGSRNPFSNYFSFSLKYRLHFYYIAYINCNQLTPAPFFSLSDTSIKYIGCLLSLLNLAYIFPSADSKNRFLTFYFFN